MSCKRKQEIILSCLSPHCRVGVLRGAPFGSGSGEGEQRLGEAPSQWPHAGAWGSERWWKKIRNDEEERSLEEATFQ